MRRVPVKVKDTIKHVEAAGWMLSRTRSSHRQYRHADRPGLVTIAGKPSDTLHPKDVGEHHEAGGHEGRLMTERRYLIVIEGAEGQNFSAYAPDLPGVVATGATEAECEREMRDAIEFHLEGLRACGQAIPEPSHLTTAYVKVAA